MAAVNCHTVRQDGCDYCVMTKYDVVIGQFLCPRSNAVVAIVAKEALLDGHIRNAAVQIEPIRSGVQHTYVLDQQTVKGAVEPKSNLDVLNEQVMDAATAAQRAADSSQLLVIIAFVDFSDDCQIVNVDRLRGGWRIMSIKPHTVAMQNG